jgi:hypothetical protein
VLCAAERSGAGSQAGPARSSSISGWRPTQPASEDRRDDWMDIHREAEGAGELPEGILADVVLDAPVRALDGFEAVLARVAPAYWSAPSPCAGRLKPTPRPSLSSTSQLTTALGLVAVPG